MLKKPDKNKPVFQMFPEIWKLIEANKCPVCKKDIKESDFIDEENIKEYSISGMCIECQRKSFS